MATARASSSSIDAGQIAPRTRRDEGRLSARGRFFALLIALVCAAPIVVATQLRPSGTGHGTHLQLGLPPCGWVSFFHRPCPTCGMTTSFTLAMRGEFLAAARAQPMGLLLCLGAGVTFWVALYAALSGSAVHRPIAPLLGARTLWSLALLALLAWAYKWATWGAG